MGAVAPQLIIVASHRRSGTHWVIDSLRSNGVGVAPRYLNLDQISAHHPSREDPSRWRRSLDAILAQQKTVIIKTHAVPELRGFSGEALRVARDIVERSKVVYVRRDGRDVLVSLWHYMHSFREDMADSFSAFLREQNDFEGITNMTRTEFWALHVAQWLNVRPDSVVSYEEMHGRYDSTLEKVAGDIDLGLLPLPEREPVRLPSNRMIDRVTRLILRTRRNNVSTAIKARTGRMGEWRQVFSKDDLNYYNAVIGRFGVLDPVEGGGETVLGGMDL